MNSVDKRYIRYAIFVAINAKMSKSKFIVFTSEIAFYHLI